MVLQVLTKIVGSKNDRELKRMSRMVARINELEPEFELAMAALHEQRPVGVFLAMDSG